MKVTVLGLGRMGTAIAERLVDAGHEVAVWNRTPGRAEGLTSRGAKELQSLSEAFSVSDVALSMISDSTALLELTSPQGGLAAAVHGPQAGLIDMSTASP